MREEISTEHEYEMFEATNEEIIALHGCIGQYMADQYQLIVEEKENDTGIVEGVVYRLGRICHYSWYLENYIRNMISKGDFLDSQHKPDGYLLEAEFEDLETLGKIIAHYDTEGKLKQLLKIEKLRYFYENFKAASGK